MGRTTPVQVSGLTGATSLVAGGAHTLALKGECEVWAWGWNRNGQLGIGVADRDAHPTPTQVSGLCGTTITLPAVNLNPSSVSFGSQAIGTTSPTQAVTLTNGGTAVLSIASITTNDDFAQTNTCSGSVGVGASCTISVSFTPTTGGNHVGMLTITDNATDSPQTVQLAGSGPIPVVGFTPGSLDFGNQAVGSSSSSRTMLLTNSGSADLAVSGVSVTG